jgi:hypothetical protein
MDSGKKEHITRRKFVKGVSCASVGIICFSSDCLAIREGKAEQDSDGREYLAAICGTFCGACPAYLAKHGDEEQKKIRLQTGNSSGQIKTIKGIPDPGWMDGLLCDGCLSGGQIAAHCRNCPMKLCAAKRKNVTRCSDCEELPCKIIMGFINTGLLHRAEYLPNLEKINKMGVQEWVKYEEERWRCPRCGFPLSWYDTECPRCGEPRSEKLFSLTEK